MQPRGPRRRRWTFTEQALLGLAVVCFAVLVVAAAVLSGALCSWSALTCEFFSDVAPSVATNLMWALVAISVGFLGGFLLGWARVSHHRVLRAVSLGYTQLIRGTPLLIQIFAIFYLFPALTRFFEAQNIDFRFDLTGAQRIVIALTLNTSAYQAEIFRAGFQSIAAGQIEAATSIGMTRRQAMRYVILPQSLRIMAPPLTNEYIIMFKDATPLAFVVAVPELVILANQFGLDNGAVLESYLLTAVTFLILSLALTAFLRALERRFAVPGLGISVRGAE